MKWASDLILGIFTRHFGAKLLALLLSLGLFTFVQASLSGDEEIRQLTLHFNLAPDLRSNWVLLTDDLTFTNLSIYGMRSKVDPLARLYRGEPVVNLAIDDKFSKVYGDTATNPNQIRIRITKDLFADDRLFGNDITVGDFAEHVVVLDRIVTKDARVEVDLDKTPPVITEEQHEYRDSKIDLKLNVKAVSLVGPASAFVGDPILFVSVDEIVRKLSAFQTPGEKGEAEFSPVSIRWQGVAPELLARVRVTADELGGDQMSANEIRRRIVAKCAVAKRKQPKSLKDVPIDIRNSLPATVDLIAGYDLYGAVIFTGEELKQGRMRQLDVKLPASLAANREFLANLVAVLDVGAARADPEETTTLFVPFYLDLRDRSRKDDLSLLALVELATLTAEAEFRTRSK